LILRLNKIMQIQKIRSVLLTIFLLAISACYAQTPAPTLSMAGLKEQVTVRRDGRGIPYIEAKNEADLYFAQGYVTAQDRLWQMDLYRRVARGETAEIFGRTILEEDKRWRKFGFARLPKKVGEKYDAGKSRRARKLRARRQRFIATLDRKLCRSNFRFCSIARAIGRPPIRSSSAKFSTTR
jgi:acyl-homoserine lactone acylase PvdQ